jgi:signal transduction histidine kinase
MTGAERVNILLVDDQPAKLLAYEAILETLDENLIKAGSAAEALDHLLRREVAIILIDVCMPDLDGFQLAKMIREHPRFQKTAIIFISAIQVTELDLLRGYALGAVDYVPVPVVPELLRAKVRVFAELHRKTRQLERLNEELEARVAERTADLAQANTELERRVKERTREREEALAQVHEMQKLESLGQLTGGVAHDFNNLLMAILGSLDVIRGHITGDARLLRLLDGAIQSAESGAALTKRMLAFARRQSLNAEAVDVAKLVAGMTEMLQRSVGPTVHIVSDFSAGLPQVRIDPNQLELALLNLTVNARDAMPSGGTIVISGRLEEITGSEAAGLRPGSYLCIGVKDTGRGMDGETLRRATEPFFTTKGQGQGTGLGLSMVDGLVAQSGGAMRINSQPNVGTTIDLSLPIVDRSGESRVKPPQPLPEGKSDRPLRVLIIDDDPNVSAGTAALVEDLGHVAIVAGSAAAALDILHSQRGLDIVIADYVLGDSTGTELAEQMREVRPGLPIVIATGYANANEEILKFPRLDKPYRQLQLAMMLEEVMGSAHKARNPTGSETGRTVLER